MSGVLVNEHLASVFEKRGDAKDNGRVGGDTFGSQAPLVSTNGYGASQNDLMMAVHLELWTKKSKTAAPSTSNADVAPATVARTLQPPTS